MAPQDNKQKNFESELSRQNKEFSSGRFGRKRLARRFVRRIFPIFSLIIVLLFFIFLTNFIKLSSTFFERKFFQNVVFIHKNGLFQITIGKITGDIFSRIETNNSTVKIPDFLFMEATIFSPRIFFEFSMSDLFFGRLVIDKILFKEPVVILTRNKAINSFVDFGDATIINFPKSEGMNSERDDPSFDFRIRKIEIENLSLFIPRARELCPFGTLIQKIIPFNRDIQISGLNILYSKPPNCDG